MSKSIEELLKELNEEFNSNREEFNNKLDEIRRKIIGFVILLFGLVFICVGMGVLICRSYTDLGQGHPVNIGIDTFKEGKSYLYNPKFSVRHLLISTKGQKIFFAEDKELADWIKENPDFYRKGNELISEGGDKFVFEE